MKKPGRLVIVFAAAAVPCAASAGVRPSGVKTAQTGIAFPEGYEDWRLIAPSRRTDRNRIHRP